MIDKRVRSPNYPALSLKEAVERIALVYRALQKHPAPREVVAKALGYASLNGASATTISAISKYGLLEGRGEEWRVSERAMSILNPLNPQERAEALRAAAVDPSLFAELAEKFPGGVQNDELLKNYLLRNGFSIGAVTQAIQAYRETSDFVKQEAGSYDFPSDTKKETSTLQPLSQVATLTGRSATTPEVVENKEDMRILHRFDFPGGGKVEIRISRGVDASIALKVIEMQIPVLKLTTELVGADSKVGVKDARTDESGTDDKNDD
jgi:hypothetical protein